MAHASPLAPAIAKKTPAQGPAFRFLESRLDYSSELIWPRMVFSALLSICRIRSADTPY
jgi:hypothetical protein